MTKENSNSSLIFHILFFIILFIGAGYSDDGEQEESDMERVQSIFRNSLSTIKTIGIVPIDFDCYNLTAGGIREYDDSISIIARNMISDKIQSSLSEHKFTLKSLANDSALLTQWKNARRFYDAIHNVIEFNIFSYAAFLKPGDLLTFTLPPMDDLFSKSDIDAVMFVDGYDDKSTARRRQLKAGAVAGAVAGAIMSAVIGIGGYTTIPSDNTSISAAIVSRDGVMYWYNTYKVSGYINMNDQKDVSTLISNLFKGVAKE